MAQASVELLIKEIKRRVSIIQSEPQNMAREMMIDNLEVDLEKYEELHKAEITDAFDNGDYCIDLPDGGWEQKYKTAEQYYNETFKTN